MIHVDPTQRNYHYKSGISINGVRAVETVPNFLSIKKRDLSEKVERLLAELSEFGFTAQESPMLYMFIMQSTL